MADGFSTGFCDDAEFEALDERGTVFVGVEEPVEVGVDEGLPVGSLFRSNRFYVHRCDLLKDVSESFGVVHAPPLGYQGAGVVGYVLPD